MSWHIVLNYTTSSPGLVLSIFEKYSKKLIFFNHGHLQFKHSKVISKPVFIFIADHLEFILHCLICLYIQYFPQKSWSESVLIVQQSKQFMYSISCLNWFSCVNHESQYFQNVSQLHQQNKLNELPVVEAELLQVHAPPFVSKETNSSQAIGPAFSRVQRRKSFIKKV